MKAPQTAPSLTLCAVLAAAALFSSDCSKFKPRAQLDRPLIFSGTSCVLVVNGYSTSFHWWEILQRKIGRYMEGERVVEVVRATKGGTPIARWMDVTTGKRLQSWNKK